jgi:hypothetical protein
MLAAAARISVSGATSALCRKGAREFFETFLAAKYAGLSFDAFKEEMEGSEEFAAFTAWRKAAEAPPRRSA